MSIQELLPVIGTGSYVIFLFVYFVYMFTQKVSKSNSIVLSSIIAVELLMVIIEPSLKTIQDRDLLRFVWFNTFAACATLVIWVVHKLHEHQNIPYGPMVRVTFISFSTLTALQIATYLDHAFIGSGIMTPIYRYGVPSIELAVKVSLVGLMLKASFAHKFAFNKV